MSIWNKWRNNTNKEIKYVHQYNRTIQKWYQLWQYQPCSSWTFWWALDSYGGSKSYIHSPSSHATLPPRLKSEEPTKWNQILPRSKASLLVSNKLKIILLGNVTGWWRNQNCWKMTKFSNFKGIFERRKIYTFTLI